MTRKSFLLAALAIAVSAAVFFIGTNGAGSRRGFVSTSGPRFVIDGKLFRFIGANVSVMFRDEDRERMAETLREAASDGVTVIRVWGFGEGGEDSRVRAVGGDRNDWPRHHPFRTAPDKWNEDQFIHLDRVLAEARRNSLRVQLCLTNWWRDTGGVTQYLEWAGIADAADDRQPFGINKERAMLFYTNDQTRRMFRDHVERIVSRRNSVTGQLYRDDPTIMSYELINEGQAPTGREAERRAWIAEMSGLIKRLDPNHLVVPGTWGYRTAFERRGWLADHSLTTIDYIDVHNYPRDDQDSFVDSPRALGEFIDNRAAAAFSINKPLVIGEFGMGPEVYKGVSQTEWFRALFENATRAGVAGVAYWTFTPDPKRGYGITYTGDRDAGVREEIRRAAASMAAATADRLPRRLLNSGAHLVPRQFAFTRLPGDPLRKPVVVAREDGSLLYAFESDSAASARFEKLGGGEGYIWGAGVGFVEYVVPGREKWRKVGKIVVRAHIRPVAVHDGNGRFRETRVTLFINGRDCGSRLVPVESPPKAIVQEWSVDSYLVRLDAARGRELNIRFAVTADSDFPFGINISNWPEGYDAKDAKPVEVEIR